MPALSAHLIGIVFASLAAAQDSEESNRLRSAIVTVDRETKHQTIRAWGCAVPDSPLVSDRLREQILDEAVYDLNLTRLRVGMPGGEFPFNDDDDPRHLSAEAFRAEDPVWERWVLPLEKSRWLALLSLAGEMRLDVTLESNESGTRLVVRQQSR